jgi:hypothetical protein
VTTRDKVKTCVLALLSILVAVGVVTPDMSEGLEKGLDGALSVVFILLAAAGIETGKQA